MFAAETGAALASARAREDASPRLPARTALVGECLFGETVEFARRGVAFDLAIEARGIERLEPVAEFRELVGRQLGDGLFEVCEGHGGYISRLGDYRRCEIVGRNSAAYCAGLAPICEGRITLRESALRAILRHLCSLGETIVFDAPSLTNPLVLERYLMSAAPETVLNWFADKAKKADSERRSIFRTVFDDKLVLQLMTRCDPLINLAIATYCDQGGPLDTLWKSGDPVLRVAIAYNTVRHGFSGLPTENVAELCADDHLIGVIFSNPSISHDALANFLECSEGFKSLSPERWLLGVHYALRNPILREIPNEDRFSDDGFDSYMKGRPFTAAWRLLLALPNDDRTASLISDAHMNIAVFSPPYEELTQEKKVEGESLSEFSARHERGIYTYVEHVLAKWADPLTKKISDDDEKYGSNRAFIRMGVAAGAAREGAYKKKLTELVRDNPDKWTRAG